jgi:hypothetical protein
MLPLRLREDKSARSGKRGNAKSYVSGLVRVTILMCVVPAYGHRRTLYAATQRCRSRQLVTRRWLPNPTHRYVAGLINPRTMIGAPKRVHRLFVGVRNGMHCVRSSSPAWSPAGQTNKGPLTCLLYSIMSDSVSCLTSQPSAQLQPRAIHLSAMWKLDAGARFERQQESCIRTSATGSQRTEPRKESLYKADQVMQSSQL